MRCGPRTGRLGSCVAGRRAASGWCAARSRAKNESHAVPMRGLEGRPPVCDPFGVKGRRWPRARAATRGVRDGRGVLARRRVPRRGDRRGRPADRPPRPQPRRRAQADDGAGRQRHLRRGGAGRDRGHPPVWHRAPTGRPPRRRSRAAAARWLPPTTSARMRWRRSAGTSRHAGLRAAATAMRGPPARAAARVPPADTRATAARLLAGVGERRARARPAGRASRARARRRGVGASRNRRPGTRSCPPSPPGR